MIPKIAYALLALFGWTHIGERPKEKKFIAIGYPHTANIDAVWLLLAMLAYGVWPKLLVKSSMFRFPVKRLFLWLGGIPVDRGYKARKLVDQIVEYLESTDEMALMLAPEGTRAYQKYWKPGFYQIAMATRLPLYLGYGDYAKKEIGLSKDPIFVSGNVKADMDKIRAFYADKTAKHPDRVGPIQLKRE